MTVGRQQHDLSPHAHANSLLVERTKLCSLTRSCCVKLIAVAVGIAVIPLLNHDWASGESRY